MARRPLAPAGPGTPLIFNISGSKTEPRQPVSSSGTVPRRKCWEISSQSCCREVPICHLGRLTRRQPRGSGHWTEERVEVEEVVQSSRRGRDVSTLKYGMLGIVKDYSCDVGMKKDTTNSTASTQRARADVAKRSASVEQQNEKRVTIVLGSFS